MTAFRFLAFLLNDFHKQWGGGVNDPTHPSVVCYRFLTQAGKREGWIGGEESEERRKGGKGDLEEIRPPSPVIKESPRTWRSVIQD